MIKVSECTTNTITIFMAGDINVASNICRKYCMDIGQCVTIEPCDYIYTGGMEAGFRIGLINYPRFPTRPDDLFKKAEELTDILLTACYQNRCTIQGMYTTYTYEKEKS